jgi:hypothetical protein
MRTWLLVLMTAATGVFAIGQTVWTPVVADQRTTTEILGSNGEVVSRNQTEGAYMRTSSGSVLPQKYRIVDGKKIAISSTLLDYDQTHKAYTISYDRHQAIEKRRLSSAPKQAPATTNVIGEETISGVHCVVEPVLTYVNGKYTQIGKIWVSPENDNLIMKEDTFDSIPDGTRVHVQQELYNVQLYQEPDAKLFNMIGSMEVLSPSKKGGPACQPDAKSN